MCKYGLFLFQIVALWVYSSSLDAQDMFPVRQLTSGPEQKGFASWAPDSRSLVYQVSQMNDTTGSNGLWIITPDGKETRQVFSGIGEHPRWSPDGKNIVFDADTGNSIKMIQPSGGEPVPILPDTILIRNGGLPCWSPDGTRIAFVERKGMSLCTYNFKTGEMRSIFRQEGKLPLPGGWCTDGKKILVASIDMQTRKTAMLKVSCEGIATPVTGHRDNFYRHIALSPDGSLLVYAVMEGRFLGLYVMLSQGGPSLPLAVSNNAQNEGAVWSPDGKSIAFNSTRSGYFDIWIMEVDAAQIRERLLDLME